MGDLKNQNPPGAQDPRLRPPPQPMPPTPAGGPVSGGPIGPPVAGGGPVATTAMPPNGGVDEWTSPPVGVGPIGPPVMEGGPAPQSFAPPSGGDATAALRPPPPNPGPRPNPSPPPDQGGPAFLGPPMPGKPVANGPLGSPAMGGMTAAANANRKISAPRIPPMSGGTPKWYGQNAPQGGPAFTPPPSTGLSGTTPEKKKYPFR